LAEKRYNGHVDSVRFQFGVSRDKMRVLLTKFASNGEGEGVAGQHTSEFAKSICTAVKLGLIEGGFTLSSLSIDNFTATIDADGVDSATGELSDVSLDPDYVQDLDQMQKNDTDGSRINDYARSRMIFFPSKSSEVCSRFKCILSR